MLSHAHVFLQPRLQPTSKLIPNWHSATDLLQPVCSIHHVQVLNCDVHVHMLMSLRSETYETLAITLATDASTRYVFLTIRLL